MALGVVRIRCVEGEAHERDRYSEHREAWAYFAETLRLVPSL